MSPGRCSSRYEIFGIVRTYFLLIFFIIFTASHHPLFPWTNNSNGPLAEPSKIEETICNKFFSPFNDSNRNEFESIKKRVIGRYGEYRSSWKPGHLHAGIDLKGSYKEIVYPVGKGQVIHVFRSFPHTTIVIKHTLLDNNTIYSMYTHTAELTINEGDWVDENTPLARLFSEAELKQSEFGTANHLHLEIRKSFADRGWASNHCMTMDELNKYCLDPLVFFRRNLNNK